MMQFLMKEQEIERVGGSVGRGVVAVEGAFEELIRGVVSGLSGQVSEDGVELRMDWVMVECRVPSSSSFLTKANTTPDFKSVVIIHRAAESRRLLLRRWMEDERRLWRRPRDEGAVKMLRNTSLCAL